MPSRRVSKTVGVEEVPNQPLYNVDEEPTYLVKLDSKKFESRSMDQVISLLRGSEGVVSKITVERQ